MRTSATISELKTKLSAYLADVRRGGTVIVHDRQTPIARLVPLADPGDDLRVEEPKAPLPALARFSRAKPKSAVDVVALLRVDRDTR